MINLDKIAESLSQIVVPIYYGQVELIEGNPHYFNGTDWECLAVNDTKSSFAYIRQIEDYDVSTIDLGGCSMASNVIGKYRLVVYYPSVKCNNLNINIYTTNLAKKLQQNKFVEILNVLNGNKLLKKEMENNNDFVINGKDFLYIGIDFKVELLLDSCCDEQYSICEPQKTKICQNVV
jgi:hypothetical protein